jgi:hypothetical protein
VRLVRATPSLVDTADFVKATGIGNWLVSTFWSQVSPFVSYFVAPVECLKLMVLQALGSLKYKFYFIFVAFNIVITFPTIWLTFKETKQMSLEDVDLLFGERLFANLPAKSEVEDHDIAVAEEPKPSLIVEKLG